MELIEGWTRDCLGYGWVRERVWVCFFKETPDSGVWLGFSYACLFRCFFSSYCFIHLIIVLLFLMSFPVSLAFFRCSPTNTIFPIRSLFISVCMVV